ncbi:hypothetical protein Moror_17175 [Moniliophthora roreri MCA 2997]|uniref:Uncharacterized protein n=1 Tax=Moniliophthora roreri (strain MCA 2997) TaxID=1381753 RepID=V2WXD8_MONRO|nr:hypothetical protein Moror_17175 [Moniliophthora roreri MCA 2997]
MTCKAKSKSTAAVASSSKSKNISLPQLSTVNAATLSVLHLHCMLLSSICHNIWHHLEGKSSPFADASALANFAFPAIKTPLVSLDEYCGRFWFPQAFMSLLMLALQLLKHLESHFSITISNNLYSSFPFKSQFYFWKHMLGLKIVAMRMLQVMKTEVKASKRPVHTIKPPARATSIVEVLACSSGSSKTKQKSQPAVSSSTQVTIKTEPSSSKHKVQYLTVSENALELPPRLQDKSSDPKGKKHAVDPPPNEGKKDRDGNMDLDEIDPSQPSTSKSIQDLDLEEIIGGVGQGCSAKENTSNVFCLLQAFGQTKAIEVL